MNRHESKPKLRWPTYLVLVLVFVFVIYPLSIGPAYVIELRFKTPSIIYSTIYRPLEKVAFATGSQKILWDYVYWWAMVTNTH